MVVLSHGNLVFTSDERVKVKKLKYLSHECNIFHFDNDIYRIAINGISLFLGFGKRWHMGIRDTKSWTFRSRSL